MAWIASPSTVTIAGIDADRPLHADVPRAADLMDRIADDLTHQESEPVHR
ncbi:hypothetical protein [Amycolatopsis sulphurea]|nr:hypothetical protein [Amycolatopsis sulphurea]